MEKFNGNKLKELRDKNGWSLRECAARLVLSGYEKTTYQTVENWEQGTYQPGGPAVAGLAKLFNVAMEELFDAHK